jgi:hypothetical protein
VHVNSDFAFAVYMGLRKCVMFAGYNFAQRELWQDLA